MSVGILLSLAGIFSKMSRHAPEMLLTSGTDADLYVLYPVRAGAIHSNGVLSFPGHHVWRPGGISNKQPAME
jgi:hypothetical protein